MVVVLLCFVSECNVTQAVPEPVKKWRELRMTAQTVSHGTEGIDCETSRYKLLKGRTEWFTISGVNQ